MAISTDPTVLVAQSRCFDTCIPPGDQPAVKTYLLAQIAGITDPGVVLNNARCFNSCITPGAQLFVQAYLSAVLSGQSTDPSTVANAARCFSSCIPQGALPAVTNFSLASKAGGSMDPSTLANLARCFSSCIPPSFQLGAQTYLMAVSAGVSTDPKVLLGLRAVANFIGGLPPGVAPTIIGDAMSVWAGVSSQPTAPTGFTFASNPAFTAVVASWDTPPAGIIQTEVWTSTDNITFVQSAIIAAPGNTTSFAVPAIGSSIYCKILWDTFNTVGPFTSVLQFTHTDWETRAFANSAVVVLAFSKSIQNNFYSALANAGILAKMITVNIFDRQSSKITHASVPIVNTGGNSPWGNNNLGDANVTANGLTAAGNGNLTPSANASTLFASDTNAGFTCYSFNSTAGANAYDLGYTNNAGTLAMALQVNNGGTTNAKIWNDTSLITLATPGAGYYSANRIGATDFKLYFANSGSAHAQVGASAAASGARQAQHFDCLAVFAYELPLDELFTPRTLSFMAFHQGLLASESALFFAAVQASLVYSGGGFV